MYDAFALIDGGGRGVTATDDKKMSLSEWKAARKNLYNYGFKALEDNGKTPEEEFAAMNATGVMGKNKIKKTKFAGKTTEVPDSVFLAEFSRWIELGEAGTEYGELLMKGE